ncbi:MAG: EamA family transporter [Sulfobacillus sp.]
MTGTSLRRVYGLLVLLGGASYGLVSPVVKLAYAHGYSAAAVIEGQFYYAAVILWVITLSTRGAKGVRSVQRGDWIRLILLGAFGTGTAFFYYKSLETLPAWLGIVLLFQFSWITFLIDFLVTRRTPLRGQWVGIGCIVIGTLLAVQIAGNGGDTRTIGVAGVLYGLGSGLTYASFLYVNGQVKTAVSPFLRAALITTVSVAIVSIIYHPTSQLLHSIKMMWVYGGLIGLLSQALPTTLFSVGIPQIGGSAAAILGSIELPVAVIGAALIIHEQVAWTAWIGITLIMGGIVIGERATI